MTENSLSFEMRRNHGLVLNVPFPILKVNFLKTLFRQTDRQTDRQVYFLYIHIHI